MVAASWAPSCFNAQPWLLIIGTHENSETFEKLSDCLMHLNREWAVKAPVLMLALTELYFPHNGNINKHAKHDLGLALGTLLNQATMLDIQAHLIAGFSVEVAREKFGIDDNHDPVKMLALGYHADIKEITEEFQEKGFPPRTRKSLNQIVFGGSPLEPFFAN